MSGADSPIGLEESFRQVDALHDTARRLSRERASGDEVAAAWQALADHPCVAHHLDLGDVFDELHQALRRAGRWDEAITARRDSIAAGYRSRPDPEADIAEILVDSGRLDDAAALYSQLRDRDPDDVWLYNSAAFTYRNVDPALALRWATDGIDVAIATGDHDQVIGQLLDITRSLWDTLGQRPDEDLVDRVAGFEAAWTRPPPRPWPDEGGHGPDHDMACAHCGYHPDRPPATITRPRTRASSVPSAPQPTRPPRRVPAAPVRVGIGWFPPEQYPEAVAHWPNFDGFAADGDVGAYNRRIEAHAKAVAGLHGHNPSIVAFTVAGLVNHAQAHDLNAGDGPARASYAAELLRLGETIGWPPGRNDSCWCRSGDKYKRCCGPTPPRRSDTDTDTDTES